MWVNGGEESSELINTILNPTESMSHSKNIPPNLLNLLLERRLTIHSVIPFSMALILKTDNFLLYFQKQEYPREIIPVASYFTSNGISDCSILFSSLKIL